LGAAALGLFLPAGAPFFWLAPLFEEAFAGRRVRALFRNGGGFAAGSAFVMLFILFCTTIHSVSEKPQVNLSTIMGASTF